MTKRFYAFVLSLTAFAGFLAAQADYRMLSVTEDGKYYKNRLDVTDWKPGEDFIYLRSYYIPWQGEDSLDYEMRMGNLKINGKLVGVDLVENKLSSINDKSSIVTVQTDPSHFSELSELPNLVALSLVGAKETDIEKVKEMDSLKALDLAYTKISDDALMYLKDMNELRVLNLANTEISDRGLKHLSGLTHLRSLDLESTEVTDSGLEYLKDLKDLKSLNLFQTRAGKAGSLALRGGIPSVSNEGAKQIATLGNLSELNLHGAGISDPGVAELTRLSNLRTLDLGATDITDASVEYLSKLNGLRLLDLRGTDISPEGLARLRKALPETEINY
ncbi:hypothetical protein GX441_08720 [bacterium]|nr:hypothetical protein [bacterium]